MWDAFVIAFAVTAAVGDVVWRRIPFKLTSIGLAAGLAHQYLNGNLLPAVAAAAVAFAAGLALFQLGAVGGGDVKLITALGAMLAWQGWILAMKVALVIAAAMALAIILHRRVLWQTLRNVFELLRHLLGHGLRPHPEINVKNPALIRVPFGVAAAVGLTYSWFQG